MNWIDIRHNQPEERQEVLFTHIDIKKPDGSLMEPGVSWGWYEKGYFYSYVGSANSRPDRMTATHWMLLPTPPSIQSIREEKLNSLL